LLVQAVEMEVADFLGRYADLKTKAGRGGAWTAGGGQTPHPRRGPARRRQHRQAAGVAAQAVRYQKLPAAFSGPARGIPGAARGFLQSSASDPPGATCLLASRLPPRYLKIRIEL
jgi:hypothetical protein